MRAFVVWGLVATLSGMQQARMSGAATGWNAVMALPHGVEVAVTYPNQQREMGRVERVTDDEIVMRRKSYDDVVRRRDILSLARLEPDGRTRRHAILKFAVIGGVVATVLAVLGIAAHDENHSGGSAEAAIMLAGAGIGALIGASRRPQQAYRETTIYVRP